LLSGPSRSVTLTKDASSSSAARLDALPFVNWEQERTEAALALQKDLLAAYEQASRIWLTRVQSEVALWSDLATRLAGTPTVPEVFEAYSKCVSQSMKMIADDGRLLADEAQQIVQKKTRSHWATEHGQRQYRPDQIKKYGSTKERFWNRKRAPNEAKSVIAALTADLHPHCRNSCRSYYTDESKRLK
jgi:hypothetical protein